MIDLSNKAKDELREILAEELGLDFVRNLNNESLNNLGNFLLVINATSIKKKLRLIDSEVNIK
jgi:hypothetical protein